MINVIMLQSVTVAVFLKHKMVTDIMTIQSVWYKEVQLYPP